MKKMLFAATITLMAACTPIDGYVIKGTIDGLKTGVVVLRNFSHDNPIAETTDIKNGKFVFTGKVTTPEPYYLNIEGQEGRLNFFLDNGEITLRTSIDSPYKMTLHGPATTLFAKSIDDVERTFYDAWPYDNQALVTEFQDAATSPERKSEIIRIVEDAEEHVADVQKKMSLEYAESHPISPYTAYILHQYIENLSIEELEIYLSALQQAHPDNRFVQDLAVVVPTIKATTEGQIAPDFTQHNPDGQPLTFSTIYTKNKLTMIDFWASWCGPCRRFNPILVALYKKYHSKGLEIVAVSLDNKPDNWTTAIAKDNLTWYHVSDLNGWNNAVVKQYNIRYIPQNIFVNAAGEIMGKRIAETDIDAFLASQLN
ncbi:MAG: AhpC/TSA family protein [Prevotellaceae bacterium]|jgi:thiol-disulfide isomerase/thioredoxin|nr:AhpC/TSA family protein [Prevotellaceae bacterium]